METMIRAYLSQTVQYFSEGREVMVDVKTMNPIHAANAAERMLKEAVRWSTDAGVESKRPGLWLMGTPLFKALVERANTAI